MSFSHRAGDGGRRRRRRRRDAVCLPEGAYHHVDFLEGNVTLDGSTIASVAEQGSVGGSMAAGILLQRPTVDTPNGNQFADFSDVASDSVRNQLAHSTAASAWPFAADSDAPFSIAALFFVEAVQGPSRRYIYSTMNPVSIAGAGFVAYINSNGTVSLFATPAGSNTYLGGAVTSPALSEGWHVLLSEYGNGQATHWVDDMVTPFADNLYTYAGAGGSAGSQLYHSTTSLDGPKGLGGVVLYERKTANAAERSQIQNALRAKLGLSPVPLA